MSAKNYKSKATISLEQQETTRKVTIDIPNDEVDKVTAGIFKNNYLRNLYADYCILNQEFLNYVISCNLSQAQYKLILYLMANMDKENKIVINNQVLMRDLKISEPTTIEAIKKLTSKKIIVRQKISTSKYELQINYDILNPLLAYKGANAKEPVEHHKKLINQEAPYIKQENLFGQIDLMHSNGEVFYTYPNSESHKHKLGAKKAPKTLPQGKIEDVKFEEIEEYPNAEEQEELNRELLEFQEERRNLSSALMALEEIMEDYTQWEIHNLQSDEPNPYEEKKQRLEKLVETLELQLDKKEKLKSKTI